MQEGIRYNTLFNFVDFSILYAVANLQKGLWYLLELNKRGQITLSNNVTQAFACACYMKQSFTFKYLSEKQKKDLENTKRKCSSMNF